MAKYPASGTHLQYVDTGEWVNVGQITNIAGPNLANETVDVTGMETFHREFISAKNYGGGEIAIDVVFDPVALGAHATLAGKVQTGEAIDWVICWPNYAAHTIAFDEADMTVAADSINAPLHGLIAGRPITFTRTLSLPTPLLDNRVYYVIVDDADTLQIGDTNALAITATFIVLTDDGDDGNTIQYGSIATFPGFLKSVVPSGNQGGAITGRMTIQVSGAVTLTP